MIVILQYQKIENSNTEY